MFSLQTVTSCHLTTRASLIITRSQLNPKEKFLIKPCQIWFNFAKNILQWSQFANHPLCTDVFCYPSYPMGAPGCGLWILVTLVISREVNVGGGMRDMRGDRVQFQSKLIILLLACLVWDSIQILILYANLNTRVSPLSTSLQNTEKMLANIFLVRR